MSDEDDDPSGGVGGASQSFSVVRFGYAANGQAVVFAHDESWTWDGVSACPTNYTKTWAREFRYDGSRARYMNRLLDVSTLVLNPQPHPTHPTVWARGTVVPTVAQEGTTCSPGQTKYTAIRLGYARNGQAVTFVHDESWCWNGVSACPTEYPINWAREFRYDGARARYLDRKLHGPSFQMGSLVELDATWTDYDDDEAYGDYRRGGTVESKDDVCHRSESGASVLLLRARF